MKPQFCTQRSDNNHWEAAVSTLDASGVGILYRQGIKQESMTCSVSTHAMQKLSLKKCCEPDC